MGQPDAPSSRPDSVQLLEEEDSKAPLSHVTSRAPEGAADPAVEARKDRSGG
jgi:hypothetical protein